MEIHAAVEMEQVQVSDIKQTEIDDTWNTKLCLWLCDTQIAWAIRRIYDKDLGLITLAQLNVFADESIRVGALARLDDQNSQDGFVLDHSLVAKVAGLPGYKKVYAPYDSAKIFALLQWRCPVELRDEGKHSLLAVSWGLADDRKFYCKTVDPWKKSNDLRLDCARAMTQRLVNGQWQDSRSIEYIGYFVRNGTDWI